MSNVGSTKSKYANLGLPSKRLDFFQVLSGVLLGLFVFGHLCLVSSILLGAEVFDFIAYWLEEVYIAQAVLVGIFLLIILHFIIAARKMPFRQGELTNYIKHAKAMQHHETTCWLTQCLTGVVLIALALIHVFEVLMDLPITTEKSALRVQRTGATFFYLLLLLSAWVHVGIGIFRMGVKYGFIKTANRKKITVGICCLIVACLIIGFITENHLSNYKTLIII